MEMPKGTVILWDNSAIPSGWQLLYSPPTPICIRAHNKTEQVENYTINEGTPHTHTPPTESNSNNFSHTHEVSSPVTLSSNWGGNNVSIGNVSSMALSNHSHTLSPTVSTVNAPHAHTINCSISDAPPSSVVPMYYTYRLIVKT